MLLVDGSTSPLPSGDGIEELELTVAQLTSEVGDSLCTQVSVTELISTTQSSALSQPIQPPQTRTVTMAEELFQLGQWSVTSPWVLYRNNILGQTSKRVKCIIGEVC